MICGPVCHIGAYSFSYALYFMYYAFLGCVVGCAFFFVWVYSVIGDDFGIYCNPILNLC